MNVPGPLNAVNNGSTRDRSPNIGHYNRSTYLSKLQDPIRILPPEISWRCILDALPFGDDQYAYPNALLDLTTVSYAWRHLILSSPFLWGEIHVHISSHDLFTTVAIFVQLSREIPLELVIWNYPGEDWDGVHSLLLPHSLRIRRLTVRTQNKASSHEDLVYQRTSSASVVIKALDSLPHLEQLDLGGQLDMNPPQLGSLKLPPSLSITSSIYSTLQGEELDHGHLKYFTDIETGSYLDDIVPTLGSLTALTSLMLSKIDPPKPKKSPTPVLTASLPCLQKIHCIRQPYCNNMERLIRITAPQLSSLDIQINVSQVTEFVSLLPLLVHLQVLGVFFSDGDEVANKPCPVYNHVMPRMHSLTVLVVSFQQYDQHPIDELFATFIILYPGVRHARLRTNSVLATKYIQGLTRLETLSLFAMSSRGGTFLVNTPTILPALWKLSEVNAQQIQLIDAPNLIDLNVVDLKSSTQLKRIRFRRLRTLDISTKQSQNVAFTLLPAVFTELLRLSIRFHHPDDQWKLSSLPQLVSIRLYPAGKMNPQGNTFCTELLLCPEACPSLQEIDFHDFVEWDLLFLMLERRNICIPHVAKITTISVPYTPTIFREPLSELLQGRPSINCPFIMASVLEETREIVCDPTIPGCLECLKNMRPHCSKDVTTNKNPSHAQKSKIPFHMAEDAPFNTPVNISAWMTERKQLAEAWRVSFGIFQSSFSRDEKCYRRD